MKLPNPTRPFRRYGGSLGRALVILLVLLLGSSGLAIAAPVAQPNTQGSVAELRLVGPATNPRVGETFTVDVRVEDVIGLEGYQVELVYNNSLIHALSVSGATAFLAQPAISVGPVLSPGNVAFGGISLGGGVDGSGVLATITFEAVAAGTSSLTFAAAPKTNLGGLPFTTTNGSVKVESTITNVRIVPASKDVTLGDTFTVDVVADYVLNSGSFQFNLAFNPTVLSYEGLTGGNYLGTVTALGPTITPGAISYGQFSAAATGPTGGPQVLATIEFTAIASGSSPLDLSNVILTTAAGVVQGSVPVDGVVRVAQLSSAQFSVVPADQTVTIGDDVYIKIHIDGAVDLGAFEFKLAYDPAKLQFIGTSDPLAGFLHSTGRTVFPTTSLSAGVVAYGEYSTGAAAGPEGAGDLVTLHFQAMATGTSPLTLSNQIATTTLGYAQPSTASSGQVTVSALPVAKVYIQPITQTKEIGDFVDVNVMVSAAADLGAFQFNLAYDKDVLEYVSLTGGTLISATGRTVTPVGPTVSAGLISYGQISSGAQAGANGGPHKLATIRFRGIGVGTSPLDLSRVILTSTKGFEQNATVTDGKAIIKPLPTANVHLVTQAACVRNAFNVEVRVDDASNLGAYQFKLAFNPALMEVVGVTDGGFLGSTGRTLIPAAPIIDNAAGTISVGAASSGAMDGPSGDGKLAVIQFRGKTLAGTSSLTLSNVILTDIDGFVQPNTVVSNSIAVKPFIIKLVPASAEIFVIDPQFTVDVVAECAYDLGGFQFELNWNASIAQVDDVRDGGFISAVRPINEIGPTIDNAAGNLEYGQISFGPNPGPSGNGVLAHIDFTALKVGCGSPLSLLNVRATDTRGQEQVPLVYGGALCVKPYALSSIGDQVWYDTNANGTQDAGEPGLAGVEVDLTGTDEFGAAVNKSATTGADGKYLFDGLRAGQYQVKVDATTVPANHFLTTGNSPETVSLARGESQLTVDFGYTAPRLFGWVFIDTNGNGIRDAGETAGIPGVAIQLRNAATNALLQTVNSVGATGWFEFSGVVPGAYKVVQATQPAGYISTSPDTVSVTIVGGQHKAVNFGEVLAPTATPTNTSEPTATPTNTPEPTATPTNTPEPTATSTNTPEPTATPTNTPEPTATPTSTSAPIIYRIYLPLISR